MRRVVLDIQGIVVEVDDNDAEAAMIEHGQDDLDGGACAFARESVFNIVNGIRTSRDIDLVGTIEIRQVD